jgi:hypothetical protein
MTPKVGWLEYLNHPHTVIFYHSCYILRLVCSVECVVIYLLLYDEFVRH